MLSGQPYVRGLRVWRPTSLRRRPSDPVTSRRVSRTVGSIDGVSRFMGLQWESPTRVRMAVRDDLINAGGLLSGAATYALVDYCMGSTLWAETTDEESIATLNISINYIATITDGEAICETQLDRRNRNQAVLRSEVRSNDGRLLATAIGSYSIFPRAKIPRADWPAV
jgi:uncharacterized protein (TIGR00369 family)